MLRRLEVLEPALNLLVADNRSIHAFYPNDDDWIAIKDTLLLLEPLEKATKYLSASSYPTMDPRNKLTILLDESRVSALQHIQDTYNIYKGRSSPINAKQYAPNSTRQYFARLQQINEEIDQTNDEISPPVIPAIEFEELNRYLSTTD
ncbi:unnamed protein product [Rhizophagus irregularis]|nr:unnamed protein product [Rhizophagus irregularis]